MPLNSPKNSEIGHHCHLILRMRKSKFCYLKTQHPSSLCQGRDLHRWAGKEAAGGFGHRLQTSTLSPLLDPGNRQHPSPTPWPTGCTQISFKPAHSRSGQEGPCPSPLPPHTPAAALILSGFFSFISLRGSGLLSQKIQLADSKKKHTITKHTLYSL